MADLLIKNIKNLYGIYESGLEKKCGLQMQEFKSINNAYIFCSNGKIVSYGLMSDLNSDKAAANCDNTIDASERLVLPCFVDSHTHIVFAQTREEEFVMRIKGKSYEEIAAAGGGILNSAKKLQQTSEEQLFESALKRLHECINYGTGAIEIKSGYGLTLNDELKMLRVIAKLKQVSPIPVKATFLGAHAFPAEYKNNREGYIKLIIDEMLPAIAAENLADYMDVFCDKGFFSPNETDILLEAAYKYGLKPKIHGNELGYTGGVQTAVKNNALSVDHLEYTGDEEINCLINSNTMPVALPGCSFFLGIPYAPLRKMIDAGLPVCLASDYNPGSTPNGRMGFVVSLACTQMKLTPEEAFNATTINGAYALELSNVLGSITKGKTANLMITKPINSLAFIPYNFGSDVTEKVIINGTVF
ncbi:MAG: imidazolonepropionase [Bacteroidia bacterium]